MLIGVGDLCRVSYSIVSYLYNGLITSVGGGRANFSAIVTCNKGFPLPLGASNRLRYFIVALPGPSI